ncbi:MAG: hypothetical protein KY467_01235, partial [Gemmatimonadetes bacterium]|nr:hypothetical protein [Gemmatimonadota bacterium]
VPVPPAPPGQPGAAPPPGMTANGAQPMINMMAPQPQQAAPGAPPGGMSNTQAPPPPGMGNMQQKLLGGVKDTQYRPAPGANQGENLSGALEEFARGGLANPSRFDSDLVKQGLGVINADAQKQGEDRMRSLSQLMARRGILGSSVEVDQGRRMLGDIEDVRSKRALDLGLEQARTYAGDRSSAANTALGTGEFQRGLGRDRESDNRFGWEAGRTTGRDAEEDRRAGVDERMRERVVGSDERNRELELLLRAYGALGS